MKTAHQFAQELLAGPDLPIVIPPAARLERQCRTPASRAVVGSDDAELGLILIEIQELDESSPVWMMPPCHCSTDRYISTIRR